MKRKYFKYIMLIISLLLIFVCYKAIDATGFTYEQKNCLMCILVTFYILVIAIEVSFKIHGRKIYTIDMYDKENPDHKIETLEKLEDKIYGTNCFLTELTYILCSTALCTVIAVKVDEWMLPTAITLYSLAFLIAKCSEYIYVLYKTNLLLNGYIK